MTPAKFEVGQVWCCKATGYVDVIAEVHGDVGVIGPGNQMAFSWALDNYTYIGELADTYLLRARPITAVNPSEALRKQAADMRAKASRMIEDANTLDRAAELLEDKAYEDLTNEV